MYNLAKKSTKDGKVPMVVAVPTTFLNSFKEFLTYLFHGQKYFLVPKG